MEIKGGCYCGAVRYEVSGDPLFQAACHCRECQYGSGGGPNYTVGMPSATFRYTQGSPRGFQRKDLEVAVTREFCGDCGTQIASRPPSLPDAVLLKVGTFDDPSLFTGPQMAIFTIDKQHFHHVHEGIPTFERMPG